MLTKEIEKINPIQTDEHWMQFTRDPKKSFLTKIQSLRFENIFP
jgi:hypothetical protein